MAEEKGEVLNEELPDETLDPDVTESVEETDNVNSSQDDLDSEISSDESDNIESDEK